MTRTACLKIEPAELARMNELCSEKMQVPTRGIGSLRDFEVKFDDGHQMEVTVQNTDKGVFFDLSLHDPDGEIVQTDAHERFDSFDVFRMHYRNDLYKVEVVETIKVGDRVRAYDMPGQDGFYIEGVVEEIGSPPHDIVPDTRNDYCFIRGDRRVMKGEEVPCAGGIYYRPQNGSFLGCSFGRRMFSNAVVTIG